MLNLNRITKFGDSLLVDSYYSVSYNCSRVVFPRVL